VNPALAAQIFSVLIIVAVGFQLALAAGMPWGRLAMGGKYPGRFPPPMRVAAVVQAAVLVALAVVVLARAGMVLTDWHSLSTKLIWGVVGFSGLSAFVNLITPSKWERILWAPVGIGLTACSVLVALS
jgi:hypothetical protein